MTKEERQIASLTPSQQHQMAKLVLLGWRFEMGKTYWESFAPWDRGVGAIDYLPVVVGAAVSQQENMEKTGT